MSYAEVKDTDGNWVRSSFMIRRSITEAADDAENFVIGTAQKFTDTTLGGSISINPLSQFNGNTDPIIKGAYSAGEGLGRYWDETYGENEQHVHLRFGLPEYNSLTTFYSGFYKSGASTLANSGRDTGIGYSVGKSIGFILKLPLSPFIAMGKIFRFISKSPASKYYYFKPAMPLYWDSVNIMFNSIMVNTGIVPKVFTDEEEQVIGKGDSLTNDDLKELSGKFDIYEEGGGIDVYAVANRAARLMYRHNEKVRTVMEQAPTRDELRARLRKKATEPMTDVENVRGIDKALETYYKSGMGVQKKEDKENNDGSTASMYGELKKTADGAMEAVDGYLSKYVEFAKAELADGSAFATFRTDHIETMSESFSNNTGESGIAQKINSASSSARSARFDLADGKLLGGAFGDTVGNILSSAKDVVMGVADSVGISGFGALAGSAFVDIPEVWENSTADMPKLEMTIPLRATYGHPLARAQKLILPLCMLLAGALPHSTGRSSYTQPFLVQYFVKGKAQCRLGIVDSLTIERGTGNIGWTKDGHPLGIDVTMSIKDLSSIMHIPISSGFDINVIDQIFSEDTPFNDYMAVLGGLGVTDQDYISRKLRLNLTRMMTNFEDWTSVSHQMSWLVGTGTGQSITPLFRELSRG